VFVQALLAEYPDLDDEPDISPWSVGQLPSSASGAYVYLCFQYPRVAEVQPFVAAKARDKGSSASTRRSSKSSRSKLDMPCLSSAARSTVVF
jgi:hypothetical protein